MSFNPADISRKLIRNLDRATLATKMQDSDGEPYASLVMIACSQDLAPLVFLSDLAVHTQNLRSDNRCSLLFDATYGLDDPLMGKRISVQGKASIVEDPYLLNRYIARHNSAEIYKQFKDFNLFQISIERIHLVAGFGRIHWINADEIALPSTKDNALEEAEMDIIHHMNADHSDAINLYASKLAKENGVGWQITGVDPEGFDLRLGSKTARCDFPSPVLSANDAHKSFVTLLEEIRRN